MVYEWADAGWGIPAVYTYNEYSCCNMLWTRDENGNKTYYDYDAANRVIEVWTDVQGNESSQNRLVTYGYDSDPRYRVNSIAHYRAGTPAVELAAISYTARDAVGNPLSICPA